MNNDGFVSPKERESKSKDYESIFNTQMKMPITGFVPDTTTDFNSFLEPRGDRTHAAIDFVGSLGTPIYSVEYGRVVDIIYDRNQDLGIMVVVEHVVFDVKYYSLYAHLDSVSKGINVGRIVDNRTQIGEMGNTATGNVHLHFEVRKAMNVNLNEHGNYASFPRSIQSYWANSANELHQSWVDLGLRFGYYDQKPDPWSNGNN